MKSRKFALLFTSLSLMFVSCASINISDLVNNNALHIVELPTVTNYVVGDIFRDYGLEVADQNNKPVTDYTLNPSSGTVLETVGNVEVTVSKQNYKSTSFTIKVRDNGSGSELVTAKENAIAELNEYYASFDLDEYDEDGRSELSQIKNDGIAAINSARTVDEVNSALENAKALMDKVTKREVIDRNVTSIYLTPPTVTRYKTNEELDLTGLRVYANYDDGDTDEVFGYTVGSIDMSTPGDKNVSVGYKGSFANFSIKVIQSHDSGSANVEIYATNDIHGQIFEEYGRAGVGKTMTYLKNHKDSNTLLIDQGDTWQGNFYSNTNRGALITDVMNYVQYDARTIGNHDFDWGLEPLRNNKVREYNGYSAPVLGANIYDYNFTTKSIGNNFQSDIADETVTYVLDNGIKVGIVGVIGYNQITSITSTYVKEITFIEHTRVIKDKATELRQNGCDVVVCSIHGGQEDVVNKGLANYVDLILCAHTHKIEETTEGDLYFGQFGSYTSGIGRVSLTYDFTTKDVSNTSASYISSQDILSQTYTIDEEIQDIILSYVDNPIEDPEELVAGNVVGTFTAREQLPNLMCKAIYSQAKKEGYDIAFSFCNEARYTLNSTSWTYDDIYQAFPFDNDIYIIDITYSEIMHEVAGWNNVYWSPDFNGVVSQNQKVRIACIDFLAFHTNASRNYDYFSDNNGDYVGKLSLTYRYILKNWLNEEGYRDGKTLYSSTFGNYLTQHSKNFNKPMTKVVFHSNYGNDELISYQYVLTGEGIIDYYPDNDPVRDGYTFVGWFIDPEGNESANWKTVSGDTYNVYAVWNSGGVDPDKGKTVENPFTVSEAISHIASYGDDGNIYYVTGTIKGDILKSTYNELYKFDITDGKADFTCYYVTLNNGVVPQTGDQVIVSGQLMLYDGRIYETKSGTGRLVSIL